MTLMATAVITMDLDDDNDGIADADDPTPLVYNVSKNAPSSLNGYVEIYFSDNYPSYGIWYATGENTSIDIWNNGIFETRYEDIYSWDSQNLTLLAVFIMTILLG